MADENDREDGFSLRRWSKRKLDARRAPATDSPLGDERPPAAEVSRATTTEPIAPSESGAVRVAPNPTPAELPPVESLTFDSDFRAFLRPGVDPDLRRAALKTLLHDPSFNVMDMLDVYVDDYSKPDPIPPETLKELLEARAKWSAPGDTEAAPEPDPAPSPPGIAPAPAAIEAIEPAPAIPVVVHESPPAPKPPRAHEPDAPGPPRSER